MFRLISIPFILALLLAPVALAHDDEIPTVAILRFGSLLRPGISLTETAVADVLQAYGFLSEEERSVIDSRQDLAGENIAIVFGDAGYDFAGAALMVDRALDQNPDVLISSSTPVTQAALSATSDMEDPPSVIFVQVVNPREAGIAQSACIKPAHVTGVEAGTSYEDILPLLLLQNPDLRIIGTLFNSAEVNSAVGAASIAEHGAVLGLTVEQSAVTNIADLRSATQGLVNKGVEIILLPFDETMVAGLPIIASVANENRIPIFHANTNGAAGGAMVGAGFNLFYEQGLRAGRLLVAYLNGEIDIASTGIDTVSNMGVRLNLDVAAELDLEIAAALMEKSQSQIEDSELQLGRDRMMQLVGSLGVGAQDMPALLKPLRESIVSAAESGLSGNPVSDITVAALQMESSQASWKAVIEGLRCTEEMIAEQQAALDAASE